MPSETYTQVAPNSTGNKVRNVQVTTVADDGTANAVQEQVVVAADPAGRTVDPSLPGLARLLADIRTELRVQNHLLVEAFGLKEDPSRLRESADFTGDAPATGDGTAL